MSVYTAIHNVRAFPYMISLTDTMHVIVKLRNKRQNYPGLLKIIWKEIICMNDDIAAAQFVRMWIWSDVTYTQIRLSSHAKISRFSEKNFHMTVMFRSEVEKWSHRSPTLVVSSRAQSL